MKTKLFTLLLLTFLLFSCSKKIENQTIELSVMYPTLIEGNPYADLKAGWYSPNKNVNSDKDVLYEEQASFRIEKQEGDSEDVNEVMYFYYAKDLKGKTITFSGKYKYAGAKDTQASFILQQVYGMGETVEDSLVVAGLTGDSDWKDFEVTMPLHEEKVFTSFTARTKGSGKIWTSGWKIEIKGEVDEKTYKADEDKEFDKSSNIQLGTLTPQMADNLEVLAKVWGFLKYYHPKLTEGEYNWDYELFRVLPSIANAKTKEERNTLLNKWVDKYGKITEFAENTAITDSTKYSRIINLNWLSDKELFDANLIKKLDKIRRAKRSDKENYYMIPMMIRMGDEFKRDKPYADITWEDQGYRIVTLFRLWNGMEYCFPYLELTDKPWNGLLKEYLPRFLSPTSKGDYQLSIMELVAHIDDSHGFVKFKDSDLGHTKLARTGYTNKVPVSLIYSKEGNVVVESSATDELKRGDIITAIEGKPVNEIIDEMRPYISASNEPSLMLRALSVLLNAEKPSLSISYIRNGQKKEQTLQQFSGNREREGLKSWKEYNLASKNILYVDVSQMDNKAIAEIMQDAAKSKGLIIDMRGYPNGSAWQVLSPLLTPREEEFAWFASNDVANVGNYKSSGESKTGEENPNYYKGKVAILVNEGTQSHGEFTAMMYRKAPKSATIGSQTAGADGNVGLFYLPGETGIAFTALGLYYPNWEVCQREGIKIDIPVRPTNKDIKEGRDVLIEKAIEYIGQ